MSKTNTKISAINKYGKFYFVFEHEGEKKYYRSPGGGLEVTTDPETGALIPLNPVQETRQVLNKEIYMGLKRFRKDLKLYVEAYWEMVAYPTVEELQQQGHYRADTSFPDDLLSLDKDVKFDVLKHIKKNAWIHAWSRGSRVYKVTDDKDRLIKNALARYSKAIYKKFSKMHDRENVPLGETCPEDHY